MHKGRFSEHLFGVAEIVTDARGNCKNFLLRKSIDRSHPKSYHSPMIYPIWKNLLTLKGRTTNINGVKRTHRPEGVTMKVFVAAHGNITRASVSEASLYDWYKGLGWADYDITERAWHEIEVADTCTAIYRVYYCDWDGTADVEEVVETLEEAKALVRKHRAATHRGIRRWRVPVEGGQMSLI
jgi:hypothetical protein